MIPLDLLRHASALGHAAACIAVAASLGLGSRVAQAAPGEAQGPGAPSEAKDDPQLNRAMKAYDLGRQAYGEKRFSDALNHFQEAASLFGSPDFQFNIGLCHEMLRNYPEAIRSFETYLRVKPDAEDRAAVETRLTELREAEAKGQAPPEPKVITIRGPDAEEVLATAERQRQQRQAERMVIAGAVVTGFGAVIALGGGVAFGVLAKSRSDDVDAIQTGGNPDGATFAEASDLEDEGTRFEVGQIATIAAGSTVAIAGAVVLALGLKRKKTLASNASVAVLPSVGRGQTGLVLRGRF